MDIITPKTTLIGVAPWNTDIFTFSTNTRLELWGQSAIDIVEIHRVLADAGKPSTTDNQTCCVTPATGQAIKAAKPLMLCCDCATDARPAVLDNSITNLIIPPGSYIFKFSGSGFSGKLTTLTGDTTTKEACDCECPQPPCPLVSVTTTSTGTTSASVTIVTGSDDYGRDVTVKLFNGVNEYEQVGVNGDVLNFTGLQPNTTYSVVAENDCGNRDSSQMSAVACPAVVLTMAAAGTNSVTVTVVSGGAAWVTVDGKRQYLVNGATGTFAGLQPDTTYFAEAMSDCGSIGVASAQTAGCPAVDFTTTVINTTSLQVTATAGTPLTISVVSQSGAVLDSVDNVSSTVVFNNLPEGAIITVKAVNECGKTKQLNVNLPDAPAAPTPPCPSFSLADASPAFKGFAFVAGDVIDPAATVPFRGGLIYPTAAAGHTVKVTDALGAVIGYAVNKSDCANPCCNPVSIRRSVDGGIIIDETDNYYIYGEIKKCDDTNLELVDRVLVKGDLLACDNTPLPCDAKVRQCCDATVFVGSVSGRPAAAGVCLAVAPTAWTWIGALGQAITGASSPNNNGRAILQLRDKAILEGNIALDPNGNPGAVSSRTYTNDTNCDALLEVDLYVSDNYNTSVYGNEAITMVHKISTTLLEPFPVLFAGAVDRTVGIHNINSAGENSSGIAADGGGRYNSENAWMGEYQQMLAPGQSVTLYAQSWLILYENKNAFNGIFTVHANKNLKHRLTVGGRIV